MKAIAVIMCALLTLSAPTFAKYERNKAVAVQKVLFGDIKSVRNISEQELIQDKKNGWKTFGGALIGGVIGNNVTKNVENGGAAGAIIGGLIGSQNKKNNNIDLYCSHKN